MAFWPFNYMGMSLAGSKKVAIRLQHANQVKILLDYINPKGDNITQRTTMVVKIDKPSTSSKEESTRNIDILSHERRYISLLCHVNQIRLPESDYIKSFLQRGFSGGS